MGVTIFETHCIKILVGFHGRSILENWSHIRNCVGGLNMNWRFHMKIFFRLIFSSLFSRLDFNQTCDRLAGKVYLPILSLDPRPLSWSPSLLYLSLTLVPNIYIKDRLWLIGMTVYFPRFYSLKYRLRVNCRTVYIWLEDLWFQNPRTVYFRRSYIFRAKTMDFSQKDRILLAQWSNT